VARSKRNNRKTRKWTTSKRMRIHSKHSDTVTFSWQEDKDGTNKQTNKQTLDQRQRSDSLNTKFGFLYRC